MPGAGGCRGALVSDHLDRDRTNNNPENLIPSCVRCNKMNSYRTIGPTELVRIKGDGTRCRAVQRRCLNCGDGFLCIPVSDPRRGKYCSRSCQTAARSLRA